MNKTNTIIVLFLALLFLNSCGAIGEGLGGNKTGGSDEFLVKKKSPLILPPSFGELPEPKIRKDGSIALAKEDNSSIEKIISQSSSKDANKKNNKFIGSIEKSIIEKINEQ